ncbi:MAG: GNAT family N-acetyltransferase [Caulobacteraceae bacterium]
MADVRPYRPGDLADLYWIADAADPDGCADARLVGQVFAAPYALFSPATVFVAEDAAGVGGYIVGVADTRAFEARLETDWWPALRAKHADPSGRPHESWTRDDVMAWLIHHMRRAPDEAVADYPAHLHINLLPRLQGRGIGRRLMERWLEAVHAEGAEGAHLAVGPENSRAIAFYSRCGFRRFEVATTTGALWFGLRLER